MPPLLHGRMRRSIKGLKEFTKPVLACNRPADVASCFDYFYRHARDSTHGQIYCLPFG
jgi:hypothetical protein